MKHRYSLIVTDILAALKEVEEKHDISIARGNLRYSDDYFEMKMIVTSNAEDGTTVPKIELDYNANYMIYGLPEDGLNKEFMLGGKKFKLIGLKPRNTKLPVIATQLSPGSGDYKLTVADVLEALEG